MRVLLDGRECGDPWTGMGRYGREVAAALAAAGRHDYTLLLAGGAAPPPRVHGGRLAIARTRVAAYSPAEHLVLPRLARRLGADLLHGLTYASPLRPGLPATVTIFDPVPLLHPGNYSFRARAYWRLVLPRTAAAARAVVTLSEAARRDLLARLPLDPRRVVLAPFGVGPPFTTGADPALAAAIGVRPPYLLAHGNQRPHKNLPALRAAFASLRADHPGLELVVSGGAAGPLADGVRPVGRVDDETLASLYAGARAYVLPSLYEGAGLTPLEAMAGGTPCLLANRAALPEIYGRAALLCEPDPAGIRAGLARILAEPGLAEELSGRGRELARGRTWERAADGLAAILDRAIVDRTLGA